MRMALSCFLITCAAFHAHITLAKPLTQNPLVVPDIMVGQAEVPGHNNATYGPVPKEHQLLDIEFLEIAPTPIIADRVFFIYLRGYLPKHHEKDLGNDDRGLVNATLTVSSSVVYPSGNHDDIESTTLPLKTIPFNDIAHLVIRDTQGAQVDYLPNSGRSDLLLDFQIPTMFLKSGKWTFSVDARLEDKDSDCLFALSMTQWLDGGLHE